MADKNMDMEKEIKSLKAQSKKQQKIIDELYIRLKKRLGSF